MQIRVTEIYQGQPRGDRGASLQLPARILPIFLQPWNWPILKGGKAGPAVCSLPPSLDVEWRGFFEGGFEHEEKVTSMLRLILYSCCGVSAAAKADTKLDKLRHGKGISEGPIRMANREQQTRKQPAGSINVSQSIYVRQTMGRSRRSNPCLDLTTTS